MYVKLCVIIMHGIMRVFREGGHAETTSEVYYIDDN
jgi:hypothetical protein